MEKIKDLNLSKKKPYYTVSVKLKEICNTMPEGNFSSLDMF